MKTISLFSGCGGMDFGAESAGAEIVFANDIDSLAAETFQKCFPDTEFVPGDVTGIRSFPDAELVMGGYPCQSFSMGGNRNPAADRRTYLYLEFARCIDQVRPKFFVAENVSGLRALASGRFLREQVEAFADAGDVGYNISAHVLKAQDYGVPQRRKRLFIVGVRRDLGLFFWFPKTTHGRGKDVRKQGLLPYTSHGDSILGLPLWPTGEFYERPHDPEGHFSWYYMSRNRKARWDEPSFTIVANFRHTTLHPASPTMRLVWSNLADGWKQKWEFTGEHEHLETQLERPKLEQPRRLSWREAARIQTFPPDFEPAGTLASKFEQIGNSVPPAFANVILTHLIGGAGLRTLAPPYAAAGALASPSQLSLWPDSDIPAVDSSVATYPLAASHLPGQ